MSIDQNVHHETNALLSEIFLTPSHEVVVDRFSPEKQAAADCNGKCVSGTCRGFV
jgi:hypothetical protein